MTDEAQLNKIDNNAKEFKLTGLVFSYNLF